MTAPHDPKAALRGFRQTHDSFVGIDSDGCAFDTDVQQGNPPIDLVSVPLVDGLVQFARIEKQTAPKRLKEYVPRTDRKKD